MFKLLLPFAALAALLHGPLHAELPKGSKAPLFSTSVAKAGKAGQFNLQQALKRGPVVLYFYPKAFTKGCTLETRAFAEAHDQFAAAGATVIGMSADDLDTLKRFSVEGCRNKFAVGVATPAIIKSYDVEIGLAGLSSGYSNRTSYVIDRDGKVAFVHSEMDYRDHVSKSLAAVKALKKK